MRLRDRYDWVVLGDHPGALLSGCMAARMGLPTLILPLVPSATVMAAGNGQTLDPEPGLLLGLGRIGRSGGLLARCLEYAGLQPSETTAIVTESVLPQVVTPMHRVLFSRNDDDFESELSREFGKNSSERLGLVKALRYAESPYLGYWDSLPSRLDDSQDQGAKKEKRKRKAASLQTVRSEMMRAASGALGASGALWLSSHKSVSESVRDHGAEFGEFCSGLAFGIAGYRPEQYAMDDLLHLLVLGRTGAGFRGGVSAYRELLLKMAKRLGAHVPPGAECRRVFVEDGKLLGVQTAHSGIVIGAGGGVLGCSIGRAREFLALSSGHPVDRLKKAPRTTGWIFSLALSVRAEAVSPGMHSRVVWQEAGAPPLLIEVVDPVDYGGAQSGVRWLFVRTTLPFTEESLKAGYQRLVAARMMRQLYELMPFVEFHILKMYPDFRSSAEELTRVYGFGALENIPENLRVYGEPGIGYQSGVEALFVANGEAYPELGSLGGTRAAVEAASWLAQKHAVHDFLR